jgi:tetratricopeptide (TPR) repeat protein
MALAALAVLLITGVGAYMAAIGSNHSGLSEQAALQEALELHREQRYEEAIRVLTRLVESEEARAEALIFRGISYHRLGRYDEAAADFSRALEVSPDDLRLYLYRGESYLAMGDEGLAAKDFAMVIEASPEDNRLEAAARAKLEALGR